MTIHTDTYIRLVNRDDFLLAEMEGFSDYLGITEIMFNHRVGKLPTLCLTVYNFNNQFKESDDGGLSYKGYRINNVTNPMMLTRTDEPRVKFEVELPEPPFGDPREFFTRNNTNNTENQNV